MSGEFVTVAVYDNGPEAEVCVSMLAAYNILCACQARHGFQQARFDPCSSGRQRCRGGKSFAHVCW